MKSLIALILIWSASTLLALPSHIQLCLDCHGPEGVSQHKDIPTIAGASPVFIEETFAAYLYDMRAEVKSKFRFGDTSRKETSMKKLSKELSEDQVAEAAAYFAKLPYKAVAQPFDAEKAKVGAAIHEERCERCHRDGGKSPADDASILAGQYTEYLKSAMVMIKKGKRDIDEEMNRTIKKLTDEEWEALLQYYASQQ